MPAIKNKPVKGHQIDLLLSCKHVLREPIEAAVFAPNTGEERHCPKCRKQVTILKVGSIIWDDEP